MPHWIRNNILDNVNVDKLDKVHKLEKNNYHCNIHFELTYDYFLTKLNNI